MKFLFNRFSIAVLTTLLACTTTMAQQSKTASSTLKPASLYDPATEKNVAAKLIDIKKVIDDNAREVAETAKKQNYKAAPKDAKFDYIPLFSDIPYPVASLGDARNVNVTAKYDPFLRKIDEKKKELGEMAVKENKYNEVYEKEGQAGLEKRAKEQSDKSVIVQQMGGTDKMMQMSEEERKATAVQVANNIKQNPSLMMSGNSPMAGFAQKYQSDPEFAARFNKMSQAEKEAEMRKFMTETAGTFDATKHEAQSNEIKQNKNQAQQKIAFDLLMQRTTDRLTAASDRQVKIAKQIDAIIEEMKNKISSRFGPLYAAVPIVELGEYGHDKDPKKMIELNIQEAWSRHAVDEQEAGLRAEAWKILKLDYQNSIGELNEFLANYKWGSDKGEVFGTYHEDLIAAAADGPYNMLSELATMAKQQTESNRKRQIIFEEAISKK